jgi:amino-acid N-acetyltransferase
MSVARVAIRRAAAADLPAVLSLLRGAGLPTEDMSPNSALQMWVLEHLGTITGAIALEGAGTDGRLLRSLVVDGAHQGCGWARVLVARAEDAALAEGVMQIVLLTETAQALFRHLGYEAIPRSSAPANLQSTAEFRSLCPNSAVCMVKQLDNAQ